MPTPAVFDPTAPFDRDAVMRRFRAGVLADLERFGPEMGEKAMQGDLVAEMVIRRYAVFQAWTDPVSLGRLETETRNWLKRREELKR